MSKGAYMGISSIAHKVKKAYIGIDGVARKVKKAYIGIDGIARLCWSGSLGVLTLQDGAALKATNDLDNIENTISSYTLSNYGYDSAIVYINGVYVRGWCDAQSYGYIQYSSDLKSWTNAKSIGCTSNYANCKTYLTNAKDKVYVTGGYANYTYVTSDGKIFTQITNSPFATSYNLSENYCQNVVDDGTYLYGSANSGIFYKINMGTLEKTQIAKPLYNYMTYTYLHSIKRSGNYFYMLGACCYSQSGTETWVSHLICVNGSSYNVIGNAGRAGRSACAGFLEIVNGVVYASGGSTTNVLSASVGSYSGTSTAYGDSPFGNANPFTGGHFNIDGIIYYMDGQKYLCAVKNNTKNILSSVTGIQLFVAQYDN